MEEVQLPLREITDNDSEEGSLDTANGKHVCFYFRVGGGFLIWFRWGYGALILQP